MTTCRSTTHGGSTAVRPRRLSVRGVANCSGVRVGRTASRPKIGQLALFFGANDMGSLMIEENVVASAGTVYYLTLEQIKGAIREAGYVPRQRNVFYEYLDPEPGPQAA